VGDTEDPVLKTSTEDNAPGGDSLLPPDQDLANRLSAGSTGTAAIFTDHIKASHVVRKVLVRQIAITNYINPF
jgi:hypothetical protein